ncbi:hypothetical protein [Thalassobius sp. I31.1]|uniref:hypothetical protein n=1 Tax=Thalassobius sp. I31.1 TaxID=2109912 RepID=UPI0013006DA6|nr:hypothetical protein [Thalassobius sp. I31.1]
MTFSPGANARQPIRPIVALTCEGRLSLCQEIVQSLADLKPGYVYRMNPARKPNGSFDLKLELDSDGHGQLFWSGGAGQITPRAGQSDAEFARQIVANASPDLSRAMENP